MKRSSLALLTVGMLAIVGGLVVLYDLLSSAEEDVPGVSRVTTTVDVLAISQDLPAGTSGDAISAEGLYEVVPVPLDELADDPIVTSVQMLGTDLIVAVQAGQLLEESDFAPRGDQPTSIQVPAGHEALAVTIPFDPAVGGYVRAGDLVGVYAIITDEDMVLDETGLPVLAEPEVRTLLRGVEVLDISADLDPRFATVDETARPSLGSITYLLAVTPEEAGQLVLVQSNFQLYLTLLGDESPDDEVTVTTGDIWADR